MYVRYNKTNTTVNAETYMQRNVMVLLTKKGQAIISPTSINSLSKDVLNIDLILLLLVLVIATFGRMEGVPSHESFLLLRLSQLQSYHHYKII